MDYKITSTDAKTGSIGVTYSHAGVDVGTYAIDVPVKQGSFIAGAELESEIQSRAPVWLLDRRVEVTHAIGFDAIQALAVFEVPANSEPTIEQLRDAKKAVLNKYRERVLSHGVEFDGHTFDSDTTSVSRLTALSNVLLAGGTLPAGFVWRSADNVDVPMDAISIFGLLGAMILKASAVFTTSWEKKAAVDAAQTKAEVDAVLWLEPGVPSDTTDSSSPMTMESDMRFVFDEVVL
jgi:hypothetical protein